MSEWLERLEAEFETLESSIEGYLPESDKSGKVGRYNKALMVAIASGISVAGLSYYNRDRSYLTKASLAVAAGAVGSLVADTVN
jgi:hypothetical protein